MSNTQRTLPWAYLDDFRGTDFKGEWPTFPEMLRIQTKRNGERKRNN